MLPMNLWQEAEWIAAIAVVLLGIFLAVGAKIVIQKEPEFAGHPKGLYMLFFAEMWERFSYYGMRALLIFYLTKHWLFADDKANLIYGAYTSLVYITPVLGGYLADKYLGQRKAVRASTTYFLSVVVPEALGLAAGAEAGAAMLYAVPAEALA